MLSLMYAVITTTEDFYRDRLLEFAHSRNRRNIYKLRSMHAKAEYLTKDCIIKVDDTMFKVQSQQDSTVFYTVDINQGTCECRISSNGSFCKHQCGVDFHYNVDMPNDPRISDDDRYTAATVTLGDDCEARQFYCEVMPVRQEGSRCLQQQCARFNCDGSFACLCGRLHTNQLALQMTLTWTQMKYETQCCDSGLPFRSPWRAR